MNILVTGAKGFVAQHLIEILSKNYVVYGLSRNEFFCKDNCKPVIVDLSSNKFERFLPNDIHCVIHLAQSTFYRDFPYSADDIYKLNVETTFRLLEWSRKNKIKHFIFASTANVYSSSSKLLDETSKTIPDSFYGATKLCAENIVRQYQKFFSVDILRFFTVYGPNQKNMLLPSIIKKIKEGEKITLAKGLGIFLSPIFVKDISNIINFLISSCPYKKLRLLNICGNEKISLSEIVKRLEALLKIKARIEISKDEPRFFIGNNNKLKKIYPDNNFTSIDNGLKRVFSI